MPDTPPVDAVQIAAAAIGYETHGPPGQARAVVAALACRFAFVEHAEVAALRAVAGAAQSEQDGWPIDRLVDERALRLRAALAALPPVDAPAPPQGEDDELAELCHWARRVSDYVRTSLQQGRSLRRVLDDTAHVFTDAAPVPTQDEGAERLRRPPGTPATS